jgi:hypothetical protein
MKMAANDQEVVISWLLVGDPAIRWQTLQDLLGAPAEEVAAERQRVAEEGWGAQLLALQEPSGLWAGGLYSPKWISTTYTMLLLRRLGLPAGHLQAEKACQLFLDKGFYHDGGINFFVSYQYSETCVTGMILSLVAYFRFSDARVDKLVDHLLGQQMADGGWNCESFKGATHSSFHTTISVLEGLWMFEEGNASQRAAVRAAQARGREFLLAHHLFKSDRTGEMVKPEMTRFSFPPRWRYDVLRALDYFQACGAGYDGRLVDAIDLVLGRRQPDGRWVLQNRHPGRSFFEMEKVREPSRWNTLRALRVLKWWERVSESAVD